MLAGIEEGFFKERTPDECNVYLFSLLEESTTLWAARWDKYLHVYDPKIQWFSLINFSLIVIILGIIIAHILMRTLKNDIVKYNEVNLDDDISDESGWKLVHADVLDLLNINYYCRSYLVVVFKSF